MIKHIIALIALLLAIWASIYMMGLDKEVEKLDRISALIKSTAMEDKKIKVQTHQQTAPQTQNTQSSTATTESSKDKEIAEKLKALKDKAGNIAAFKVSPLYKKSCASCHGATGEGVIGPKLRGDSKEKVLQALKDFKSGKRKNYVMYGLLGNISDAQIEELAEEISTFQAKLEAANK
jgi:cytochrome c553